MFDMHLVQIDMIKKKENYLVWLAFGMAKCCIFVTYVVFSHELLVLHIQLTVGECPCEMHSHLLEILRFDLFTKQSMQEAEEKHHQHIHSISVNSLDNNLLHSCINSIGHYNTFVLESWQGKVCLMSHPTDSDICVATCSSSG